MRIKRSTPEAVDQIPTTEDLDPPDQEVPYLEEKYVIWQVNRGRAMIAVPYDETTIRRGRMPEGHPPDDVEPYRDAVSDLLQAAHLAGLDVDQLCADAVEQQRSIKRQGDEATRRRTARAETQTASSNPHTNGQATVAADQPEEN